MLGAVLSVARAMGKLSTTSDINLNRTEPQVQEFIYKITPIQSVSEKDIAPLMVLVKKPRTENREFTISIPKQVVEKMRLDRSKWVDLVVMDNFVLVKRYDSGSYRDEPFQQLFLRLDEAIRIQYELSKLREQRREHDTPELAAMEQDLSRQMDQLVKEIIELRRERKRAQVEILRGDASTPDVMNLVEYVQQKQRGLSENETLMLV